LLLLLNLQVGTFDPYSDDPRLAVKKVALCPVSGTLVVAGTAGSVIVSKMNSESVEKEVKVFDLPIKSAYIFTCYWEF
jgi:lethal(2) giant larvae protein